MTTFSNPRTIAEFNDWPSGRNRVKCKFEVEHNEKKGYRVIRTTTDKNGVWCKPKADTYNGKAVIVDGEDGKTYILQHVPLYGFVMVNRSDFMSEGTVHHRDQPEAYAALLALINSAY